MPKRRSKAKKVTPLQLEYKKQVKRLKALEKRMLSRGFILSESLVPQKPKRITKASVRRLAEITPPKAYKKAEYIDQNGKLVSGTQGRKLERERTGFKISLKWALRQAEKRVYYKPPEGKRPTDERFSQVPLPENSYDYNIIAALKSELKKYPVNLDLIFSEILDDAIDKVGMNAVSRALQEMPESFHDILIKHTHDSAGAAQEFAAQLVTYIPDEYMTPEQELELWELFDLNEAGYEI